MEPSKALEPTLNDIGTRYEHLKDHLDGLLTAVERLKTNSYTQADKDRLIKLSVAAEVLQSTIDAFAGFNDPRAEYYLYRVCNDIPKKPEEIEGGRGTPLL